MLLKRLVFYLSLFFFQTVPAQVHDVPNGILNMVQGANLHEKSMAMLLFRCLKESVSCILAIFACGGYMGKLVDNAVQAFGYAVKIVMHEDGAEKFNIVSKRWMVEWSFAWMNAHGRLSKDYEFLCESPEKMVQLSSIKI